MYVNLSTRVARLSSTRALIGGVILASIVTSSSPAASAKPVIPFGPFARTGLRLAGIAWTGRRFVYVENTTNRVFAAGPSGTPLTPFAKMPTLVEETRCRVSPGAHGFRAGDIYCHSPDNKIYRIGPGGGAVHVFATLPAPARSDGALAFDTVGGLGYDLIAATGRSGGGGSRGGIVFAVDPNGKVRRLGVYGNAGGADEIAIAPAGFGSAAGQVLLAIDAGRSGSLVAMDKAGRARTLLTLSDGPNPLVVIPAALPTSPGHPRPGMYVTDTLSHNVFMAPASALRRFAGDVVTGSELGGLFWAVAPKGRGFVLMRLQTSLAPHPYNLEDATFVGG